MKRAIPLFLLLTLGLLGACGKSDAQRVSVGANPPATGPGVTTPPSTTPGAIPAPANPEEAFLRGNRNDKTTALGRLCWIQREVALTTGELLSTTLSPDDALAADDAGGTKEVERVKALVHSLPDEAGSDAGLPQTVRPFRARLDAAVNEARGAISWVPTRASSTQRQQAFEALTRILDFEHFPAVREFAAAAKADPTSCPDISFGIDPSKS